MSQISDEMIALIKGMILRGSGDQAMNELTRYDAARRALADARAVDEVKDIRDKAVAMQVYARQAKDQELIEHATEIRLRAERRLGEMMAEQPKAKPPNPKPPKDRRVNEKPDDISITLAEAGIDKNLANRARKAAALSEEQFERKVTEAKRLASSAINRAATTEEKREHRSERESELAAALHAENLVTPVKRYGVVYADPPWRFEPYSRDTGMDRAPENHYPTTALDGIKMIEIPAADDAVLFMWATAPMLPEAIEVVAAWGFKYKSHFIWIKDKVGPGYWARNKHELLLIGTRGNIPAPAPGSQYASAIEAPRGEHSSKPFCFREMIEEMFPNLPRIELFARERFEGWDAWGLDAPAESLPQREAAE